MLHRFRTNFESLSHRFRVISNRVQTVFGNLFSFHNPTLSLLPVRPLEEERQLMSWD